MKELPNPYHPAVLALWATHGFTAEVAQAWMKVAPGRFTPWTAREWAQKGFDYETAALFSARYADPETARVCLYAGVSDPFGTEPDDDPPPPPDPGRFGDRLRQLRVRRQVSLFRLARVLRISYDALCYIEMVPYPPSLDKGVLLAEALRVSPRHLAFGDDPPRPKRNGGGRP